MPYREYNFDGLVGPTHNYAGLGTGNLASMASKHHVSSPKAAALEGLAKMKLLAEMGVPQAILPPQRRPHVGYLRARYGSNPAHPPTAEAAAIASNADWITDRPAAAEVADLLRKARENGEAGRRDLAIASSASSMWAANAATVSPSPDTADGRLHITPANLVSQPHRALEAAERWRVLAYMFGDMMRFDVHPPLPRELPDEGAANHTRFCITHAAEAFQLFVYGREDSGAIAEHYVRSRSGEGADVAHSSPLAQVGAATTRFMPRQLRETSRQVAMRHELLLVPNCYFLRQRPEAIDAGVFHNDVISVGNENVLLVHELAYASCDELTINGQDEILKWIADEANTVVDVLPSHLLSIRNDELPLPDAVKSYLFNSQLVTLPGGSGGGMALIYPAECDEVPTAKAAIERILREDNPVERAVRVDVRQSMKNGGGPACLRLRVVLSDQERAAVRGNVFWTPELHETLVDWVNRHYRDTLTPQDLADVRLYEESMAALDELAEILALPI